MKSKHIQEVEVTILNDQYKVYLFICDEEYIRKYVLGYFGDDFDFSSVNTQQQGLTFYRWGLHPVIWIRKGVKVKYSVLAHEAVHAINFIWEYIKEETKDEVYAHSIEAIVRALETIKLTRK